MADVLAEHHRPALTAGCQRLSVDCQLPGQGRGPARGDPIGKQGRNMSNRILDNELQPVKRSGISQGLNHLSVFGRFYFLAAAL
jgi:hypothetical protein